MEPLFFKAENIEGVNPPSFRPLGFNGAAFFQSGKYSGSGRDEAAPVASMEPLFFKAENIEVTQRQEPRNQCFNGAAFFQSGKYGLPGVGGLAASSFNGAAFFQSGK